MIAGIDEAGRGCVLGPLVIAGAMVPENDIKKLEKLGVKDSKMLTPSKRESLAERIEEIANIVVLEVGPCKIDNYKRRGINLNKVESMKFAEILNLLAPMKAYIDGHERNTEKVKKIISKMVRHDMELIVENFADRTYPIVSAASIIAKVERDKKIEDLKKKHGNIGSGYPSDEVTMTWLRNWLSENKGMPDFARKTWMTSEGLMKEKQQTKMNSFFNRLKSIGPG